jgi:hypothetical protein
MPTVGVPLLEGLRGAAHQPTEPDPGHAGGGNGKSWLIASPNFPLQISHLLHDHGRKQDRDMTPFVATLHASGRGGASGICAGLSTVPARDARGRSPILRVTATRRLNRHTN